MPDGAVVAHLDISPGRASLFCYSEERRGARSHIGVVIMLTKGYLLGYNAALIAGWWVHASPPQSVARAVKATREIMMVHGHLLKAVWLELSCKST